MHAIFDDSRHAIVFAGRIANGFTGRIQEGVTIAVPDHRALREWTVPPEQEGAVLCIARADPKRYRLYYHLRDIDKSQFIPTGRFFGGIVPIYPPGRS